MILKSSSYGDVRAPNEFLSLGRVVVIKPAGGCQGRLSQGGVILYGDGPFGSR